ncbi:uncharacterized protein LOC106155773 [Lingula anatina]|uniref:Uncharacterized protein LOC106155773 n=1 Tax=Lingula anatina TaxID=7574 RepID=A0A1S3HL84_LINAN|nr:uncharacterized protein LOC106155773 [Lingula anatina]|eukprot:XP_013386221.1 uncharacterized protein LOC106155773 [Lingula anatina]
MHHHLFLLLVTACLARADNHGGVTWSPKANEVIDLTHHLHPDTPVFPGSVGFNYTRIHRGPWEHGAGWLEDNDICGSDLMGTALLAPARWAQNRWYVNEIPPHRFFGPVVKVDVSMKVENYSNYNLLVSDLKSWESQHGRIPDNAILLVQTGWSKHYGNKTAYFGTDAASFLINGEPTTNHPGISDEAAMWLAENTTVYGVGIDSPGIGPSSTYTAITSLHKRNIYTIVGAVNLHKVPAKGYSLAALPMNVENGTASLVRLLAFRTIKLSPKPEDTVDLTYALNNDTVMWIGRAPFQLFSVHKGPIIIGNNNLWIETNRFCGPEHMGTHLDAPTHFIKDSWRIHQIPPHGLIGPAVRIDIDQKAANDPDAVLTVEEIKAWERENGRIPENAIVFLYTGWGKYVNNFTAYLGTDNHENFIDENGVPRTHWPGFSAEAGEWLVSERQILGVGIDALSFDVGFTVLFKAHVSFLGARVLGLENIANLDKLPKTGTTVFVFHMVYVDGSGAATRVVALKDGLQTPTTPAPPTSPPPTQCVTGSGWRVLASLRRTAVLAFVICFLAEIF